MELITLILVCVNTVAFTAVFFIQKSQISQTKGINDSMKKYMDIFDVDKLKKYVDLNTESAKLEAQKIMEGIIMKDEKIQRIINQVADRNAEKFAEMAVQKMTTFQFESTNFVVSYLKSESENNRIEVIKKYFPKSGNSLLENIKTLNIESLNNTKQTI
jgi:hypothetical protein